MFGGRMFLDLVRFLRQNLKGHYHLSVGRMLSMVKNHTTRTHTWSDVPRLYSICCTFLPSYNAWISLNTVWDGWIQYLIETYWGNLTSDRKFLGILSFKIWHSVLLLHARENPYSVCMFYVELMLDVQLVMAQKKVIFPPIIVKQRIKCL